jgi:hypothetical protein
MDLCKHGGPAEARVAQASVGQAAIIRCPWDGYGIGKGAQKRSRQVIGVIASVGKKPTESSPARTHAAAWGKRKLASASSASGNGERGGGAGRDLVSVGLRLPGMHLEHGEVHNPKQLREELGLPRRSEEDDNLHAALAACMWMRAEFAGAGSRQRQRSARVVCVFGEGPQWAPCSLKGLLGCVRQ